MRSLLKHWTRTARDLLAGRSKALTRTGWMRSKYRVPAVALRDSHVPASCRYSLYVPPGLRTTEKVPLLVMLHGCRQNAEIFAEGTRMNTLASERRFIVLYPEQSVRSNALRCWNWFRPTTLQGGGEALMIASLVRRTVERYPVDASRVYVAGMSAGGGMAAALVFCCGQLFTACAVVSGVMYRAAESVGGALEAMRSGSRALPAQVAREAAHHWQGTAAIVPTLIIHGDQDARVHPRNAEQTIEQLRAFAECLDASHAPVLVSDELRVTGTGRTYRRMDYRQNERLVARKIIVEGLQHAWSGGDDRHPFNDAAGPDASLLVWEFVSMFRRDARL